MKQISKNAYHNGIVIVRCPGCDNQHLIADRLGWLEDGGNWDVLDELQKRGENARLIGAEGITELTYEDIMGRSRSKPQSRGKDGDQTRQTLDGVETNDND